MGEAHQLADVPPDLVPTGGGGQQEAAPSRGRRQLDGALAVRPRPGGLQRGLGQIGGEHAYVPTGQVRQQLPHHHGDGVGLLAGGAAGTPDAQPPTPPARCPHQLRQHLGAQRPHLRGVAEEVRLLDGHLVQQALPLRCGGIADQIEVRRDVPDAGQPLPFGDRGAERGPARVVEDQACGGGEQLSQAGQVSVVQ